MIKKRMLCFFLAVSTALGLAACGSRPNEIVEDNSDVTVITDINDLEDDKYYIQHGDEYYELYVGEANFDTEGNTDSDISGDNTLWFTDDWGAVPTMYLGDRLVYKTSSEFSENFEFERFKYLGYSVGVCGLSKTSTGRYRYDFKSANINSKSDASRLSELSSVSDAITVETIGGSILRSGNISDGGSIIGLSAQKAYDADIYAGTKLHHYKLIADCVTLESMDYFATEDYDFDQSQVVVVNLPSWMNTGYYYAGSGNGLFRYVRATSYTKDTDFNIANVKEEIDADKDSTRRNALNGETSTEKKAEFTINEAGKYTVTVSYGTSDQQMSAPVATVSGGQVIYTLDTYDGSTLKKEIQLEPGDYVITIKNLYGRSCDIKVTG